MSVIYKATNRINGKSYIGFSTNYSKRKKRHEKRKHGEYFHKALKKYGVENFEWTILKENAILEDEIQFIEEYQTFWEYGKGYNLTKGGEGCLGRIVSDETKEKISESVKILHKNSDYRKKIIESWTEERKQKARESMIGDKNLFYGDRRFAGENNPFYGKQHDPELKKRMNEKTSQTMKGKPPNNAEWTKGTFWWNNGIVNKRSKTCPGNDWKRGTIKMNKSGA
jgi:group I intron endonuclease